MSTTTTARLPRLCEANPIPVAHDVRVTPAHDPAVLIESPPGEKRWGFYQFPDMWRAPGGEIYCAVNVGHDCLIGEHEPSVFFVSRDNGRTWSSTPHELVDMSPDVVTFSDGSQVAFGEGHYVYHVHSYGEYQQPWQWWELSPGKLPPGRSIRPCTGPIRDSYDNTDHVLYRYEDVPPEYKPMPMRWRASAERPWQHGFSTVEASGLCINSAAVAWWYDANGKSIHEEQPHRLLRVWPRWGITKLPDDTLLWPHYFPHPDSERHQRFFCTVALLASTDRGRTWHRRSMIADDTELTTDGYSGEEHSLQVMPDGSLLCVMRTVMGDRPDCTMWLAASRSTDNGFTWSRPHPVAPFSVTPLLMTLANGKVALAYGRPGVYVRASADSGRSWTEGLNVVGPTEAELLRDRWWDVRYDAVSDNKISCGNLGAVVTGPGRFLLAYSDFRHRVVDRKPVKAVMVHEFVVA